MYGCPHRFELDTLGVVAPWIAVLRVRRTQIDVDQADLQEAMEGMLRVRTGAACTRASSVQKSRTRKMVSEVMKSMTSSPLQLKEALQNSPMADEPEVRAAAATS